MYSQFVAMFGSIVDIYFHFIVGDSDLGKEFQNEVMFVCVFQVTFFNVMVKIMSKTQWKNVFWEKKIENKVLFFCLTIFFTVAIKSC